MCTVVTGRVSDDEVVAQWESIARSVTRAQQQIVSVVEDVGVPGQWFSVLLLLLRSPEHRLPMNRLARELSITSGGFTKLADRMGREGLIDRRNSSGDRRVIYAALTAEGLELARRADRQYREAVRRHAFDVLSGPVLAGAAESLRPLDTPPAPVDEDVPDVVELRDASLPDRRRAGR